MSVLSNHLDPKPDLREGLGALVVAVAADRGSNNRSSGVVLDWATGAEVRTPCPDTSGSRKVSYTDLRDVANFAYEEDDDDDKDHDGCVVISKFVFGIF